MADPVNLNRFRKDKVRADNKARADENVVRFGRTKAQKRLERTQAEKADRDFSGHENTE